MKLHMPLGGNRIGISAGALRGISMLLRFPALVWMASNLNVSTFAQFILAQTTVILFTFLVGLELHQAAVRSFVQYTPNEAHKIENRHRKNGMAVAIPSSILLILILIFISNGRIIESIMITIISMIEYRQTEFGRYLIVEGRNTASMWLSLLRQAAWMPIACVAVSLWPQEDLLIILSAWIAGSIVSEIVAKFLRPNFGLFFPNRKTIDSIVEDIPLAFPFFLIVLSVMAREQLDKIIIKIFAGDENLAIYGFFATLSGLSLAIIQTTVISENARTILNGAKFGAKNVHSIAKRNMYISIFIAMATAAIVWTMADPLLHIMGRDVFLQSRGVLALLLLATVAQAANNTQTLALTALHQERRLAIIEVSSAILSIVLNLILVPHFGALAAAAVLGCAASVTAVAKWRTLSRLARQGSPF